MRKVFFKYLTKVLWFLTFQFDASPPMRRDVQQEELKAQIKKIDRDIERRFRHCRKNRIDSVSFRIIRRAIKDQKKVLVTLEENYQLNWDVVYRYHSLANQLSRFIDDVRRGNIFHHV